MDTRDVSEVLGLSTVHTLSLARALEREDVGGLIDKREGQKQEYRFTAEVKAELIQQFVLDIVAEGRASGRSLSEHLLSRCELRLSERSIRDQLGLSKIKESLPNLLLGLKKLREIVRGMKGQGAGWPADALAGGRKAPATPRIGRRVELARPHRASILAPQIAWFTDCHRRTVGRWVVRVSTGEPVPRSPS